ncbi:hypothetical protein FGE12_14115 [Aggregicoccus sp. 17bor-14]|uniref:hypothetical protein n=1 Tax=Myxococcaceae TaxID=31 RepID=UPI00129D03F8|nr:MULTISPECIES: hypothetical protein [Myxococcaceae]MBF5043530.1 hypothetical protein [Simulacricoccus sp. 17bor-14]MRI89287.1 hypothetical protein [Aggregicoccus sp. 17bor-14]
MDRVRECTARWAAVFTGLALATGCATTVRLDDTFDADATGAPPAVKPPPTPPDDTVSWTQTQRLKSTVEAAPGGGRWLHITPEPAFVTSPDERRRALLVGSDTLTTSPAPTLRGHLRVRLDGPGTVTFGLQTTQGTQSIDFIGGFAVGNFGLRQGLAGQLFLVGDFSLARMEGDILPLASRGKIADYTPGTVVDLSWSIDQASRTLSVGANGGTSQSLQFPQGLGGAATTPISRLTLYVWLERPTGQTNVFLDDLRVEEVR